MAKKLDPVLVEIFKQYDINASDALWDCHGTWVAYHKAIERIAAKADIVFDMPQIIEANTAAKTATIVVRGKMGDNESYREEWSFGEASPANNKNTYPFAMAEKRAKDRVVLKLVGLHGLVYSEEENDAFKASETPNTVTGPAVKSSAALKREGSWETIVGDLREDLIDVQTVHSLNKLKDVYRAKAQEQGWTKAWMTELKNEFDQHEDSMKADDTFPGDKPNGYVNILIAGE
jgi:hypothetical protein